MLLWCVAGVIGLLPIASAMDFGGVLPWTKYVSALVLGTALLATLSARGLSIGTSSECRLQPAGFAPTVMLVVLAFYGWLQTVSLPVEWVGWLSPASRSAYLFWAAPLLSEGIGPSISISIAPFDSMHSVAVLVLLAVLALLATLTFASRGRLNWLLWSLALAGATIATIGVLRKFLPGFHLWSFQSGGEGAPFGTFLNRNNAALGINFGVAASMGLLVYRLFSIRPAADGGVSDGIGRYRSEPLRPIVTDPTVLAATVGIAIGLVGLVVCESRGGLLSTVIAGAVTATGYRRHSKRLIPVLTVLAAVIIAIFFLFRADSLGDDRKGTPVQLARLQSTLDLETGRLAEDTRLQHWPDGFRAAARHFPCGSGLATYGFAYLPWQQTSPWRLCQHADNLWLETFVELGLPGIVWGFGCGWLIVRSLKRLRHSADPLDRGLAACGCYVSVVILTSQMFDFGLIVPCNAFLATTLFATIVSRSTGVAIRTADHERPLRLERFGTVWWKRSIFIRERALQIFGSAILLVLMYPAIERLRLDSIADTRVRTLPSERQEFRFDYQRLSQLTERTAQLAALHPDPDLLSELTVLQFQLGRLQELADSGFSRLPTNQKAERYAATARSARHLGWRASQQRWQQSVSRGGSPVKGMPVKDSQLASGAPYKLALEHTEAGLRQRPLALVQRSDEVFLEFVHQTPERTVLALQQSGKLFRNTPELLLRLGSELADLGQFARAADMWRRAIQLRPSMLNRVLGRAVHYQGFPLARTVPDVPGFRRKAEEFLRVAGRTLGSAPEPNNKLHSFPDSQ